jgi:hypothetical protein
MTHVPETQQRVKFYQTGTFTVGNRLLDDGRRTVQANVERSNSLDSGHRACHRAAARRWGHATRWAPRCAPPHPAQLTRQRSNSR